MKYPVITPEERRQRLEPPRKKIHVVIDSDTYNEVDDQFAISYAMLSPEKIQMEAIYAAPFSSDFFARLMQTDGVAIPMTGNLKEGLELSYQEILKLLGLLGREDFKDRVFRGSERYMTVKDQPVDSDAARDLVKRVHECEDVLYVIAIGEITNVASAILMDPEIIKKMVVVWLSGQPLYWPHAIEFNLGQDVLASQVILDSGVPLVLVPCQPYQQQMPPIISGETYLSIQAFYLAPLIALILTYTALYFAYHVRLKIHPHGLESLLQKRRSAIPYIFQTIQNDSPERQLHTTPLRFFQNRNQIQSAYI